MARNGSGVQTSPAADYPAVAATLITATHFNNVIDDINTGITNSLAANGETPVTANLPMNSKKFTGLANGAARTDSVAMGQVQDGTVNWVAGGGTADAITATFSPAITALIDGQMCFVRATAANTTTTPTFAPNGLTAHTITKNGAQALVAGDIFGAGHELILRYKLASTIWELMNPAVAATATLATTANTLNSGEVTVTGHATTADIFGAAANSILFDDSGGAITVTAIPAASKAGLTRDVRYNGATKYTAGANLLIKGVPSGTTITLAAGATARFRAISTTQHEMTYELSGTLSTTFTFNGSGGTSASATLIWKVENGFVSLFIPSVTAVTGTSSTELASNTVLPACARPSVLSRMALAGIINAAAGVSAAGGLAVTTAGNVLINRDGAATAFTNSDTAGTGGNTVITYCS